MNSKGVLGSIAGGGVGFFLGGPLGAGVGALVGYVAGKWAGSGEGDGPAASDAARAFGGWEVIPATTPAGNFKWFDELAQKSKPAITFKVQRGSEYLTLKGTLVKVDVIASGGSRYWIVRQDADLSMMDPTGADKLPPKGALWRLYDNEIVGGDNSGV